MGNYGGQPRQYSKHHQGGQRPQRGPMGGGECPAAFKAFKDSINTKQKLANLTEVEFALVGGLVDKFVQDPSWQKDVKMTQLRRFFAEVKSITRRAVADDEVISKLVGEVALLHPLLHYAKGRNHLSKHAMELLIVLLEPSRLQDKEDFERLDQVMTTIVAYHKYYGEKKEG